MSPRFARLNVGVGKIAVFSRCHRTRHATRRAMLAVISVAMAIPVASCASGNQLAQRETTSPLSSEEVVATAPGHRVAERNAADGASCDELAADPLRGLIEQEPDCSPSATPASTRREECPAHCFEAIIVEVDEDRWRVIGVQVLGESGTKTPATVHRTAGYGGIGSEVGKRVEFTCTYQYNDEQGMPHYGDCYQGSPEARARYEIEAITGPGDVGPLDW